MKLDDRALPAARHLVTDAAGDLLRVPVAATGGELLSFRVVDVLYRPGSDVVVRYSAKVSWNGDAPRRETLVAASTIDSTMYPGVIPLEADTASGPLDVGLWRWPFDPILIGLGGVVTPRSVAALIGEPARSLSLDIVAYRPTERAVVRVDRDGSPIAYIKVVAPTRTAAIVDRHDRLLEAGVPVAGIVDHDDERGIIVMDVLHGPTLRELVKHGGDGWPDHVEFDRLAAQLGSVEFDTAPPPSRLVDGGLHARMLAGVVPALGARLDRLAERFEDADAMPNDGTVHGDLYDAQVIVDSGRIVGLLDVDDVGPGASIDDRANLIARLMYRSINRSDPASIADEPRRRRVARYAESLRDASAASHERERLGLHVAACLVGLATGPFRMQSDGWRDAVGELIAAAEALCMREVSSATHDALTPAGA